MIAAGFFFHVIFVVFFFVTANLSCIVVVVIPQVQTTGHLTKTHEQSLGAYDIEIFTFPEAL